MAKNYDVIIIGGGPNGLTEACYLSRAGLKVLVCERRNEIGGGLATEQITLPDFYHNTHAIYHFMGDYSPTTPDFEFEKRYGIKYIRPEHQFCMPLLDGNSISIYTDVEKTCQSIAKFSKKDADSYRTTVKRFQKLVDEFMAPATYLPSLPALDAVMGMERTEWGKDLNELTEMTPEDIINGIFEHDVVRTLFLWASCHWGLQYDMTGVSYMVPLLFDRSTHYCLVQGGSHRMSNALTRFALEYGCEILTSAEVSKIIVENGVAKGIELSDGSVYMAGKAVISTLDVDTTFLKFIGEKKLNPTFVEKVKGWEWDHYTLCHQHMALREAPKFKAAEKNPDVNKAFIYVLGFENQANLKKVWDSMLKKTGEIPQPEAFSCCFPSVHDPYQAPKNRCSGLISQMAPYELKGGKDKWLSMRFKEERAEILRKVLEKYAPNMTKKNVMFWNMTTPADIENKFPNMVKGSIKQGAYDNLQMGHNRPNDECSNHVTPIKNLYIGGASSYPGGFVTYGPGVGTANKVADDLKIKKWWKPTPVVEKCWNTYYK